MTTLVAKHVDLTHNTVPSDTKWGQQLLTSLSVFVHTLVHVHTTSEKVVDLTTQGKEINIQPSHGVEGRQLLEALTNFLRANLSQQEPSKDIPNVLSERKDENSTEVVASVDIMSVAQPKPALSPYGELIQDLGQDRLRLHVFNKMPIRLLTFSSSGSGLELIERNEILRRLQGAYQKISERTRLEKKKSLSMGSFIKNYAGYAILSHTWIRDRPGDVIYSEWANRESNHRGFAKIAKFCEVAAKEHGLTLGWMDTVCINKDSSSELDESIRSMYKWYREAHVCVAYLSETWSLNAIAKDSWFTRGWTLQELLSPKKILFYNANWENFVKNEEHQLESLAYSVDDKIQRHVQQAAKITEHELKLCQKGDVHMIPISRRIQLASERHVTREEDEAYSLMGILGVDISVAYGEGAARAFSRLMRELIMSQKDVMDIFNYGDNLNDVYNQQIMPVRVWQFKNRSTLFDNIGSQKPSMLDHWQPLEPIILTHMGVRIPLLLMPALREDRDQLRTPSPYGDFFGTAKLAYMDYFILHREIYSHKLFGTPASCDDQTYDQTYPLVATFGVFNFGVDDNMIMLPDNCMCVPLNCGTVYVGNVGPNSIKTITNGATPVIFQLQSMEGRNIIRKDNLRRHGMQLMTLYL